MAMQLTPAEGLLIREFDLERGVAEAIRASGHDVFTGWSWSVEPAFPAGVEVVASGDTLIVGWPETVPDLFPIELIRYRLDGAVATVAGWGEVPAAAEIVQFAANGANKREYRLTATASGLMNTSSGPVPVSATGQYLIQVLHQYNANRDILKERIHAGGE